MPQRKTAPPRGLLKTPVTDGRRLEHFRYHPSPDLAAHVEHFWTVRWDLRGLPRHRAETLPHPSVHLVFESGVGGRIAGVSRGKFSTLLSGKGGVFAAKFRPGGFYAFARKPVVTLTDSRIPVGELWGRDGSELERAVLSSDQDDARIALIERFLRDRRPEPDERAVLAGTIVDTIATERGMRTVRDVGQHFGMTARGLQRLFEKYVGVNPKWVIQRYRLHEATAQLDRNSASQAGLALELGYADQAHFVHDFKAVVGTSPAAYAKRGLKGPD
jgi:AraC-like DNA-binding protein